MTLLHEIQSLLEHTYGATGVNFAEFLVDSRRHDELAGMSGTAAGQISDLGRTFLRVANGKLCLGIYYQPCVIEALENENPQCGLTDNNILPFMVFLEELNHAVHASLKFLEGRRDIYSEAFVRDLELQAKVDSYLILQMYCAFFNRDKKVHEADKRWLKACLFDSERFNYDEPELVERYRESNRLGRRYVKHLDSLSPKRRTSEIRQFRKLDYQRKTRRIAAL